MKKEDLFKKARDPKYIPGSYNYCDRWCERCQFTSRCLNCTIVEETAEDLKAVDKVNEDFWKQLFEILGETLAMVKEMARETGVDIEKICHVKLKRALDSAADEALYDDDDLLKIRMDRQRWH